MKKSKKGWLLNNLEYAVAFSIISIVRLAPLKIVKAISNLLGDLLFFVSKKRRNIAAENLRHAFRNEKSEKDIQELARKCCRNFFYNLLDTIKLNYLLTRPDMAVRIKEKTANLNETFTKAKKVHDESGGAIFVTPHIGSWEMFPHISAALGLPLVIVARPMDNEHIEKLVFANRSSSGQVIIPKKNALFALRKTLREGSSVGMLPDQSTMKGLMIDFFGRPATTTPVPALLSIAYNRPIVITACCRVKGEFQYEGFVSDPIMPGKYTDKKAEIIRLTEEMTREMESIIRKYPEQYLWIHNRWKTYKGKKEIFSGK
jgi:KDO2-lipid IV(A) lauroyltransferase